ncbi:MAG: LacI family DNA-binding transcriptional regulator [Roseburia sp.]|nr:LacI family DNA-binding transcriptional regulator [Roseburia sp.]MCM1096670.1 LacI family DNA-binding transcriptional regulator [Ruminococcus flavefaciens]
MAERVTIQDIANALGVSRNTVSKAINNTGVLADATREKILQKAAEMGYKQFSYINATRKAESEAPSGEIALFFTGFIGNSHFSSTMLDKFQRELSLLGYSLTMHRISPEMIDALQLPASYRREQAAGIICIEMFDRSYAELLCTLDTPILFVDSPVIGLGEPLRADCLYMENQSGVSRLIQEMIRRGKRKIGFIGEYMHCQSFFERYTGYLNALYLSGLPLEEKWCFTGNKADVKAPDGKDYQEYLEECFRNADSLPDVFLCANDFVALDTLQVFKRLGISVPGDIWLCGFDDSPESTLVTPTLTTVHIHSQILGFSAVHLLISRIKEPSLNFRTMHTETSLIYRESTGD